MLALFTAVTEELFNCLKTENGVGICGEKPNILRFSNDMILPAESEEILKIRLETPNEKGKRDSLKINNKRTNTKSEKTARTKQRNIT